MRGADDGAPAAEAVDGDGAVTCGIAHEWGCACRGRGVPTAKGVLVLRRVAIHTMSVGSRRANQEGTHMRMVELGEPASGGRRAGEGSRVQEVHCID